jgi:hypothetical protein
MNMNKKLCDYCGAEIARNDIYTKNEEGFVISGGISRPESNANGWSNNSVDVCFDCYVAVLTGKRSIDPSKPLAVSEKESSLDLFTVILKPTGKSVLTVGAALDHAIQIANKLGRNVYVYFAGGDFRVDKGTTLEQMKRRFMEEVVGDGSL